jgi:hypothetical protein
MDVDYKVLIPTWLAMVSNIVGFVRPPSFPSPFPAPLISYVHPLHLT